MNQRQRERIIDFSRRFQNLRTGRSLHFSFILEKRKILCWATNNCNQIHLEHRFGQYVDYKKRNYEYVSNRHSECEVLKVFINKFGNSDVSGLTLFNLRLGVHGEVLNSQPCQNCQRNIIDTLNWKNVFWT